MSRNLILPVILAVALATSGCATPFYMGQQPSTLYDRGARHMPESIRAAISTVSVRAGEGAPSLYVGGDYGAPTQTVGEGAASGAVAGVQATNQAVAEDPRALILWPFILPVAVVAGTIAGAAAAAIEQQVQKYRDGLTDDMLAASGPETPSSALALEFEKFLGMVDAVKVVDAAEADAALTITLTEIAIIVEDNDAEISASASAVLRDRGGSMLHEASFDYWDRDTLRNWAKDDNALWEQFTGNARRHIARVASADLFQSVATRHVLRPAENDWVRGVRAGEQPTLEWDFVLLGGDAFDGTDMADNPVRFDLEIYEGSRLVYAAHDLAESRHEVAAAIPKCSKWSWTVRPLLTIEGRERAGEWMRRSSATERMQGRQGVTFMGGKREYWDGFAEIGTRCAK